MYKCIYKAQNTQSTKNSYDGLVGECTCSGRNYKTKVARAGSLAGGGVKGTGTENNNDKRIFVKVEVRN